MTRKRTKTRPQGYHPCHLCGYDHDLEEARAQAWHEQHGTSAGDDLDPLTLERRR